MTNDNSIELKLKKINHTIWEIYLQLNLITKNSNNISQKLPKMCFRFFYDRQTIIPSS